MLTLMATGTVRLRINTFLQLCTKPRGSLVSYLVKFLALESGLRGEVHQVLVPFHPSLLSVNYLQTIIGNYTVNLPTRDHSV